VPAPYRVGNPAVLDRGSAYWAHKYLQNIAQLRYSRMIGHIQANSRRFEQRALALVEAARSDARQAEADGAKLTPSELSSRLWKLLDDHASEVLAATWSLTDQLMVMYADGTLTTTNPDGSPNSVDLGYSVAYLEANGYTRGPPRTGELPGGATWGAEPHLTIRDGTTKLVALDSSSGVAASAPKGLAIVGGVVGVAFASVAVWFATVKGLAVRNGLDMAGNDALTAWPAAAACSAADDASNAEDYRPFSA